MAVETFDDIPELGPDMPTGAGSRRRSAAKSRSRREPNRRRRMIIVSSLAVVVVGAIVYSIVTFVTHDARFRLNAVQVQGSKYVTAVEIEDKFTGDKDRSVMTVPLQRRRMQVEQIPWVRSASVRRILPNSVVVTVSERVPVAFVAGEDGVSLIDQDGVVLDAPKEAAFHFPIVSGINQRDSAAMRRDKMHLFMAVTDDLRRGGLQANASISELDVQDAQDARAIVSDSSGTVQVHLGKENFMARYLVYLGHIDEWKKKFPTIESVDLRYEGQVVINADPQSELKSLKKPTSTKKLVSR